jgi:hypothetical protein
MSQSQRATGSFDVKVNAAKPDTQVARAANLSRLTIDKRFHGDLEGISKGEMLALQTETKGSAGYVALERVTGKLKGRSGSFVLQHSATMSRGDSRAEISVVPDSATGELRGLSGNMIISASDGAHSYEFDFRLGRAAGLARFASGELARADCLAAGASRVRRRPGLHALVVAGHLAAHGSRARRRRRARSRSWRAAQPR